jgi:hypothetical protein
MNSFEENTTVESFPLRNVLLEMWKKSWCGLVKLGLVYIRIFETSETALGFYFQVKPNDVSEVVVLVKPGDVKTVEDILRLVTKEFQSEKMKVRFQIKELQERVSDLENVSQKIVEGLVMREVERRLNLPTGTLTTCMSVSQEGCHIMHGASEQTVYVVEDTSQLLRSEGGTEKLLSELKIASVPVKGTTVPHIEYVWSALQTRNFEGLRGIDGVKFH